MGATCTQPADQTTKLGTSGKCTASYSQCQYLIRLNQILKLYNDWQSSLKQHSNQTEQDNDTIDLLEYINNAMTTDEENTFKPCSTVSILEHYHHLIDHHSIDFEEIYHYMGSCSIGSCNMISRNHRDRGRDQNDRARSECYYKSSDSHQVIIQQILDQMHCYLFHTFDMGFALTKQEKMDALKEEKEEDEEKKGKGDVLRERGRSRERELIGRVIQSKKKEIRELRNRIGHGVSLDDNNKFMSNIDAIESMKQDTKDSMFSFGVRYYYDEKKYKDNDDLDVLYNKGYPYSHWFVDKKYSNLKEALVSNDTQCISKAQYKDLYYKSKEYLQTEHVRLKCGKNISIEHLLCIMLYCNFDVFQSEFSKTYRHRVDEDDESLKLRHSEFAIFGEILQNAVQSNGTMVDKGTIKTFYHGINRELMFTSTLHRFCGPISTSSEYSVAMVFTQKNGIILELKDGTLYTDELNSVYFDCEWISDFGYEKEKLFVSTKVPLKIVSIFHVRLNENYGTYIKLITILLSIIEGDVSLNAKEELTDRNIKAIVKLLKHELSEKIIPGMPQYITKLLHHICLNIKRINARYNSTFAAINSNKYYSKYKSLAAFWCDDECQLFKLDLLCKLFPNLTSIAIVCSSLTDKVFDNILQFLGGNGGFNDSLIEMKLTSIVFQSPVDSAVSFVKKYFESFNDIDWNIEIENKRLIIKNKRKQSVHDRTASTNVLNAKRIFSTTEIFVMNKSLDVFAEDM